MIRLPLGFTAQINESGIHTKSNYLKVRVDIYPPIGSRTYPLHYVDHFDRQPTEEEFADETQLALVPKHKELNPCLCHFFTANPEDTKTVIEDRVRAIFDAHTLQGLDDELAEDNSKAVNDRMNSPAKRGQGKELRMGKEAQATLVEETKVKIRD